MPINRDPVEARWSLDGTKGRFFTPVVGLTASRILVCDLPTTAALLVHLCLVAGADLPRQRFLLDLAVGHLPPSARMQMHLRSEDEDVLFVAAAAEVDRHLGQDRRRELVASVNRILEMVTDLSISLPSANALSASAPSENENSTVERIDQWVSAHRERKISDILEAQRGLVDAAIAAQVTFAGRLKARPRPVIDWRTVETDDSCTNVDEDVDQIARQLAQASRLLERIPEPSDDGLPTEWSEAVVRRLEPKAVKRKIDDLLSSITSDGSPLDGADLNLFSELAWHVVRVAHPIPASPRELSFSLNLRLADAARPTRLPPTSVSGVTHTGKWFARTMDPVEFRLDTLVSAVARQQLPVNPDLAPVPPVIDWMADRLHDITNGLSSDGANRERLPWPLAFSTSFDLSLEQALLKRGPCSSLFPVLISDEVSRRRPVIVWALAVHEQDRSDGPPRFDVIMDDGVPVIPGITRPLKKAHIKGPLVIRLVGSPMLDLTALQAVFGKDATVQHMVAVGEFEALTLAPSLAGLEGRQGADTETITAEIDPEPDRNGEPRKLAHWKSVTSDRQIAHFPTAVRQIVGQTIRNPNGRTRRVADGGGEGDGGPRIRDWVFVGQSLADWSFRSQMYFLPASQWGAQARQRPLEDSTGPSTAVVFDWDIGVLEAQFLDKLAITMYSCDLDALFGPEVRP